MLTMRRATVCVVLAVAVSASTGGVGAGAAVNPPQLVHTLRSPDRSHHALYGDAVAVDGATEVVGAPQYPDPGGGAAFVYTHSSGHWIPTQTLTVPGNGATGDQVAVSGSTIAVGTNDRGTWQTALFQLEAGTWVLTQTVPGLRAAISGSLMVVGSTAESAEVYELSGGAWTPQQTLTAPYGVSGDGFGLAVATNGTDIAVGAPHQANEGAVYTFRQVGGVWTVTQAFHGPEPQPGELFGFAIGMAGTTLAISAPHHVIGTGSGAVDIFNLKRTVWRLGVTLVSPTTTAGANSDNFGAAVATDGQSILVGAPIQNANAGAAYLYTKAAGRWSQTAELDSPLTSAGQAGTAVAVEPGQALVGRPLKASGGAAYVYAGSAIK